MDLAYFSCRCRGVKFYQLSEVGTRDFTPLAFVRDPSNMYDRNCVEVKLRSSSGPKIGHVEKNVAAKLSCLLLQRLRVSGLAFLILGYT